MNPPIPPHAQPDDDAHGLGLPGVPDPVRPRWTATTMLAVMLVVAALYLGRDIFVPFALAALLGFILDPVVTRLRRIGLPRAVAVALVMVATVAALGATSVFVGRQVVQLGKNLPTYQSTVQQKLRSLRQLSRQHSALDDASRLLGVVGGELDAARKDLTRSAGAQPPAPQHVVVETAQPNAMQTLRDLAEPVLGPVGTAGIVLVFLVFILLERHDLRDRLLRLAGGNLHRSTDALGEAADRVSRYLTMQLLVNLSYGVPMAVGLWAIGVPGALLWGLLAALLRFVPYVGPVIAAIFPLTLAFAVDPGWQMLMWALALVLTLELISNNLIEPWLYGASTGLSPVSIIVSAVFWTSLWGPIGLILATPLTVCLAVLGRHMPQLAWLDVLLGSSPVFDAPTRLYQRLLAGDVEEAIELAGDQVAATSPADFYNDTGVPALRLAAIDHTAVSSTEHRHRVASGLAVLLRDLRDEHPAPAAGSGPVPVLCIGARWEVDSLAAEMLAHALALGGQPARALPATVVSADHLQTLDLGGVRVVCLSSFSPLPQAQVRFVARRLKRRQPGLRVVAALWNAPAALLDPAATDTLCADAVAQTLAEAVQRIAAASRVDSPVDADAPAPPPVVADAEEATRLKALHDSGALAPALRVSLDRLAQRAADVFDTPLAMVTVVDAQTLSWRGAAGLDRAAPDGPHNGSRDWPREWPRDGTPCAQVVADGRLLVVPDSARDPRFADRPLAPGAALRFYAGAPLRTRTGQVIGTLCVLDHRPRTLDSAEQDLLQALATEVMDLVTATRRARQRALRRAGVAEPGAAAADPAGSGIAPA